MTDDLLMKVMETFLPKEFPGYFDIVDIRTENSLDGPIINIYLDEKANPPEDHRDAVPNGFYEETAINDFPIRERKTILRVRRRRWKDSEGRSFSRNWQLIAKGTRLSKEFAEFLKKMYGLFPDHREIPPNFLPYKGG